ncbi:hypothetical protein KKF84_06995 [Myxococcota bacterium]|nr:hypothetical protein [Myxococcota bacterium]MBU1535048.1 hypothetical protein [Myxococcota bacterium]
MKAQLSLHCPVCSGDFTVEGIVRLPSELKVVCPGCSTELEVNTAATEIPAPVESGEGCPKCGAPRRESLEACPRCGLVFQKWQGLCEPFSQAAALAREWEEIRELPLDDARHFSFLEECFKGALLDDAARAYLSLGKEKGIDVSQKIRQLEILAQMNVTPRERVVSGRRKTIVLICALVFFLLITWFIWSISPGDLLGG